MTARDRRRSTASAIAACSRPGMLGDVNVIDFDARCSSHAPEMVHDLPGDARRFVQGCEGYVATVKRGEVDPARRRGPGRPPRRPPARRRRAARAGITWP